MEHPDHIHHAADEGEHCDECQQAALELFNNGDGLPIIYRHDMYNMIAMVVCKDDGVPQGMSNFLAMSLTGHRNAREGNGPLLGPVVVNFAMEPEQAAMFAFAILETVAPIITTP